MPRVRLLTLNMAHGRGTSAHQMFLGSRRVRDNLLQVADLIRRWNVDVCALQEVDIRSFWNGGFSHAQFLLENLPEFKFEFTGQHMSMPRLSYGTALLSKTALGSCYSHCFRDAVPMPRKGFVIAEWTGYGAPGDGAAVDLVSVHFDFARPKLRGRQMRELVDVIEERGRPAIVMGDFNATWQDRNSVVKKVVTQGGLRAFLPKEKNLATFWPLSKRYDWILVPETMRFVNYETPPQRLSDHLAVVAEVDID